MTTEPAGYATHYKTRHYKEHLSREDYTKEETYSPTRAPVDLAVTLLPDAYTSQEFFDIEREQVFAKSWIAVGPTSRVEKPGQTLVAKGSRTLGNSHPKQSGRVACLPQRLPPPGGKAP